MRRIPRGSPWVSTYQFPFSCCRKAPSLSVRERRPFHRTVTVEAPEGRGSVNWRPANEGGAGITFAAGSVPVISIRSAFSQRMGSGWSTASSICSTPVKSSARGSMVSSAVTRVGRAPGGSRRCGGMSCACDPSGRMNLSANRSLWPRLPSLVAGPGEALQSRASSGLLRKVPSATSLKPAFSTSSLTTSTSMRWRDWVADSPLPGFAELSITT